ncbi:MAG TPA: CHC2 zinc finger domain-containing protein, partial [Longimicrobiales bacterium]|nr:CHC2 zinc finger domain-containing protein [Longimicrobiales bacterium]
MIPDDQVEEVRLRADIVDIIGELVPLKKAGREYKACCPFHEERTPSFYVVPDKGFYKCFGCGKSGDVFSFIMERMGLDFVEAVKHVAGRSGV